MTITINDRTAKFDSPVTVYDALKTIVPEQVDRVLGVFRAGRVLELGEKLDGDCTLIPITYHDEEGRRIYERSLRFVFLMAIEKLFPTTQVRIEHSIGQGLYIRLLDKRVNPYDIDAIRQEMLDIVAADLPFTMSRWSRKKAIDFFEQSEQWDKSRLLAYRQYDYFHMYQAGGTSEYFYGAMVPSTGYVKVFDLLTSVPGLVLMLPDPAQPDKVAAFHPMPKHMVAFAQSNYWCQVLECVNAADVNDLIIQRRLRDFIRLNEAFHNQSMAEIADDIINRQARAIFIAGPSSSGKTTFANRLSIQLRVNGLQPVMISLDDFYINREDLPLEADGQPDLEAITALDIPLFHECMTSLLSGKETELPVFDFTTKSRSATGRKVTMGPQQLLVVEGIHGLNPALHTAFDERVLCRIYISQLTCINLDNHNRIRTTDVRLLRRMVRDHSFRNTRPEDTLNMWDSVRRGEEKWIFPYQEKADIVFNSALHYELPILKHFGYDLLKKVPKSHPQWIKASRLIKILNYFVAVNPSVFDEIPPLSILREFIGGNPLYYPEQD